MNATRQIAGSTADSYGQSNRQIARIVGVLFIMASVSAILGTFYFYPPILAGPNYLVNGAAHQSQVAWGALMELILVCSNIGTAIGLFPILRRYGERIALGHLCFRYLECVFIAIGIVSVLSLLNLSREYVAAPAPDAAAYHTVGSLLHAVYSWTFALGPLVMLGVNTSMYSSLLYKSKLVPRPLAVLGIIGAVLVLVAGLLVLFGVVVQLSLLVSLLAAPIAIYEMVLAGWLIVKGFSSTAVAAEPLKPVTNELPNPA